MPSTPRGQPHKVVASSNPELTFTMNREATIALLCEGVTPTVAKVRARSKRGNAGDVSHAIRETLVQAGGAMAEGKAAWHGAMPLAVVAAFQRVWEELTAEARKAFEERLRDLEENKETLPVAVVARLADDASAQLAQDTKGLHDQVRNLQAEVDQLRDTAKTFKASRRRAAIRLPKQRTKKKPGPKKRPKARIRKARRAVSPRRRTSKKRSRR